MAEGVAEGQGGPGDDALAGEHGVMRLVLLASAPWATSLLLGQLAALWLAMAVIGLVLWNERRDLSAGVVLGLLATKPVFLIPFALFVLRERRSRIAIGIAISIVALVAISAPAFGTWIDWAHASSRAWQAIHRSH